MWCPINSEPLLKSKPIRAQKQESDVKVIKSISKTSRIVAFVLGFVYIRPCSDFTHSSPPTPEITQAFDVVTETEIHKAQRDLASVVEPQIKQLIQLAEEGLEEMKAQEKALREKVEKQASLQTAKSKASSESSEVAAKQRQLDELRRQKIELTQQGTKLDLEAAKLNRAMRALPFHPYFQKLVKFCASTPYDPTYVTMSAQLRHGLRGLGCAKRRKIELDWSQYIKVEVKTVDELEWRAEMCTHLKFALHREEGTLKEVGGPATRTQVGVRAMDDDFDTFTTSYKPRASSSNGPSPPKRRRLESAAPSTSSPIASQPAPRSSTAPLRSSSVASFTSFAGPPSSSKSTTIQQQAAKLAQSRDESRFRLKNAIQDIVHRHESFLPTLASASTSAPNSGFSTSSSLASPLSRQLPVGRTRALREDEDDIIDLETMEIVEDRGVLRGAKPGGFSIGKYFGSALQQRCRTEDGGNGEEGDLESDEDEESEEESEDELWEEDDEDRTARQQGKERRRLKGKGKARRPRDDSDDELDEWGGLEGLASIQYIENRRAREEEELDLRSFLEQDRILRRGDVSGDEAGEEDDQAVEPFELDRSLTPLGRNRKISVPTQILAQSPQPEDESDDDLALVPCESPSTGLLAPSLTARAMVRSPSNIPVPRPRLSSVLGPSLARAASAPVSYASALSPLRRHSGAPQPPSTTKALRRGIEVVTIDEDDEEDTEGSQPAHAVGEQLQPPEDDTDELILNTASPTRKKFLQRQALAAAGAKKKSFSASRRVSTSPSKGSPLRQPVSPSLTPPVQSRPSSLHRHVSPELVLAHLDSEAAGRSPARSPSPPIDRRVQNASATSSLPSNLPTRRAGASFSIIIPPSRRSSVAPQRPTYSGARSLPSPPLEPETEIEQGTSRSINLTSPFLDAMVGEEGVPERGRKNRPGPQNLSEPDSSVPFAAAREEEDADDEDEQEDGPDMVEDEDYEPSDIEAEQTRLAGLTGLRTPPDSRAAKAVAASDARETLLGKDHVAFDALASPVEAIPTVDILPEGTLPSADKTIAPTRILASVPQCDDDSDDDLLLVSPSPTKLSQHSTQGSSVASFANPSSLRVKRSLSVQSISRLPSGSPHTPSSSRLLRSSSILPRTFEDSDDDDPLLLSSETSSPLATRASLGPVSTTPRSSDTSSFLRMSRGSSVQHFRLTHSHSSPQTLSSPRKAVLIFAPQTWIYPGIVSFTSEAIAVRPTSSRWFAEKEIVLGGQWNNIGGSGRRERR
ncbi:hypothetical protein T439DRAFT_337509 [Meredithblackwellia eburnea MCA 4105]